MSQGAEIGHAYLAILPSAKGIGSKLTRQVAPELEKSGRDSGSRFGHEYTRAALGPLRVFGEAAAGIFAVDKIGGFLKSSVDVARQAQKQQQEISQVIKTTGGAAHITADQVDRLSTSISNQTGIQKLAVQGGARMLLTFKDVRNEAGKGNDIFNQSVRTVNDLAAAMAGSGAQGGGDSIRGASIQLGKALNDPIRGMTALTRVGVTFSNSQRAQIKSMVTHNHLLGAQKIILHELHTEFGGAAKASTTMGQKVGVEFENIKEKVGKVLLPAIDSIEGGFLKLLPKVTHWGSEIAGRIGPPLRTGLSKIRTLVVDHVLPDVKLLTSRVKTFVGGLVSQISTAIHTGNWSDLGKNLGAAIATAINGGAATLGKITDAFSAWLGKVDWVGIGISLGRQAPSLLAGVAAGILNFNLGGLLKGLAKHWRDVLFAVIAVGFAPARLTGKIAELLARIPLAGRLLSWAFRAFDRFSTRLVKYPVDALRAMGRAFLRGFGETGPGVTRATGRFLEDILAALGRGVTRMLIAGGRLIDGLGRGILRGFVSLGRLGGRIESRILTGFRDAALWLLDAGEKIVSGLASGIVNGIGKSLGGAVGKVTGFIKDHFPFSPAKRGLLRDHPPEKWGANIVRLIGKGISDGIPKLQTVLHDLTRSISQSGASDTFKNHWNDALSAVGKSLTALTAKFKAAQSAQKQLASNLISGADPANAGTATVAGLIGFDRQQNTGIAAFTRNLALMRKHGFRPGFVATLAAEGLDAAPLVANLAHATASQVRTIDRLNHSIRANATALADSTYSPQLDDIGKRLQHLTDVVQGDGKRLVDAEQGIQRHRAAKARTHTGRKR